MRHAARILLHLVAGVSGMLLVITIGFWVASYSRDYRVIAYDSPALRAFAISRGEMSVAMMSLRVAPEPPVSPYPPVSPSQEWNWQTGPSGDLIAQDPRWLDYGRFETEYVVGVRFVVPIAFIVVLFAIPPLVAVTMIRRRRRHNRRLAAGMCVRCGYDLRATPEKCPECGAASR